MAITEAARNEFPFLVDISTGNAMAQGILIAPEWVLTSAALLEGSSSVTLAFGAHTNSNFLFLEGDPQPQQTIEHEFVLHEGWNRSNFAIHNIALIRLASPPTLNAGVQPISTLSSAGNTVGQAVSCVGRGLSITAHKLTPTPQVVGATVAAASVAAAYFGAGCVLTQQVVVDIHGADIHTAALITRSAGGTELMGLFNYGANAVGGPEVYLSIADYADWIMCNSGVGLR
ncbi:MAG: trypsin-like serine protease [Leptothrix sp. (in: b-proteobacteria)]